ncbi:MAG: ABC transporter ATP-binding protein [Steroidobacteraceae bacterium]
MTAVFELSNYSVQFETPRGPVSAVSDIALQIDRGECVAIVGESGAGKSQTFLAALGLAGSNCRVGGTVMVDGMRVDPSDAAQIRPVRGAKIGVVFQDPLTSLAPHLRIGRQIEENLLRHRKVRRADAGAMAIDMLRKVRMPQPEFRARQFPHQLSGGMRQRAMLAMVLAAGPRLLVADEPTTALDVTVQAQVLAVLAGLLRDEELAVALISHDIGVVAGLAHRVLVMYAGRIVESGPVDSVLKAPRHPYTRALLAAVPRLDDAEGDRIRPIAGQPPDPAARVPGCAFAPRCQLADELCRERRPLLAPADGSSWQLACHHHD